MQTQLFTFRSYWSTLSHEGRVCAYSSEQKPNIDTGDGLV